MKLISDLLTVLDPPIRRRVAVLLGLMLVAAALEILGLGAVVPIIAVLAKPDILEHHTTIRALYDTLGLRSPNEVLSVAAVALVAAFVVKNFFLAFLLWYQSGFAMRAQLEVAERLFRAYMRSPYIFHLRHNSAQLIRNVNSEVDNLVQGVLIPLLVTTNEAVVAASILALLLLAEPMTAVVTLIGVAGVALALNASLRTAIQTHGARRSLLGGEMNKWVIQGLGGLREAKVTGREEYFVLRHRDAAGRYGRSTRTLTFLSGLPRLAIETAAVVLVLAAVVLLVKRGSSTADTLAILGLFALAATRLMPSATRIVTALASVRFFRPVVDIVVEALQDSPEAESIRPSSRRVPVQSIEFQDVWFQYPATETWALSGVSFKVQRGKSVALIGRSGSGKSTLVGVLLGLLSPARGAICIDGAPATGGALRGLVGYVAQEPFVLDDTVRRNVAFGQSDADIDDDRVWRCLEQARLGDHVRRLNGGLDALLGERGGRFSGGERQRLAIARALYADPQILVFDEATSALDPRTEGEVAESIVSLARTTTVVVIAHRRRTIAACAQLLLLEHGRMLAHGDANALLQNAGPVHDLMRETHLEPAR